jgi:hypothetical protein
MALLGKKSLSRLYTSLSMVFLLGFAVPSEAGGFKGRSHTVLSYTKGVVFRSLKSANLYPYAKDHAVYKDAWATHIQSRAAILLLEYVKTEHDKKTTQNYALQCSKELVAELPPKNVDEIDKALHIMKKRQSNAFDAFVDHAFLLKEEIIEAEMIAKQHSKIIAEQFCSGKSEEEILSTFNKMEEKMVNDVMSPEQELVVLSQRAVVEFFSFLLRTPIKASTTLWSLLKVGFAARKMYSTRNAKKSSKDYTEKKDKS